MFVGSLIMCALLVRSFVCVFVRLRIWLFVCSLACLRWSRGRVFVCFIVRSFRGVVFVCLFVCLFACLFVCVFVRSLACLVDLCVFVCVFVHLFVSSFDCVLVCLCVCLLVCVVVRVRVCLASS